MKLIVRAMQLSLNCLVFKFVDGYLAMLVFVKYLKKNKLFDAIMMMITSKRIIQKSFDSIVPRFSQRISVVK